MVLSDSSADEDHNLCVQPEQTMEAENYHELLLQPKQSVEAKDDSEVLFQPVIHKLKTPELVIQDMVAQIPNDHVVPSLCHALQNIENDYPVILWLLFIFNDINQFNLIQLLSGDLNYGFTKSGFGVNQAYLDDVLFIFSKKYGLSNSLSTVIKKSVKQVYQNKKIEKSLFAGKSGRMAVFTPIVAKAMLYQHKDELMEKITNEEITLGE